MGLTTNFWTSTPESVQSIQHVIEIIPVKFNSNQNILKIWHQVETIDPLMTVDPNMYQSYIPDVKRHTHTMYEPGPSLR